MDQQKLESAAETIWEFMLLHQSLQACDAVFILGSRDDRVASYGASLFLQGYGRYLIISGGAAHANDLLRNNWSESTEAEHFAAIARSLGVLDSKLIIEDRATNTGQNIEFVHKLLQVRRLKLNSFVLVQKPYMERRTYATFKKQWPDQAEFVVTSPSISYSDYFDAQNPKGEIWNIMVGDLQRIREYPKLGFQIKQTIPPNVWQAYELLTSAGYVQHLIK